VEVDAIEEPHAMAESHEAPDGASLPSNGAEQVTAAVEGHDKEVLEEADVSDVATESEKKRESGDRPDEKAATAEAERQDAQEEKARSEEEDVTSAAAAAGVGFDDVAL